MAYLNVHERRGHGITLLMSRLDKADKRAHSQNHRQISLLDDLRRLFGGIPTSRHLFRAEGPFRSRARRRSALRRQSHPGRSQPNAASDRAACAHRSSP